MALIVSKGTAPSHDELKAVIVNNGFSKLSIPERFEFLAEIPKTSVGKINKKLLRINFPQ